MCLAPSDLICALAALAGIVSLAIASRLLSKRNQLPPGPPTSWFGSVALPKTYQWLTYAKWRQIYGDVIYVYVFGNPIVVLNSLQAVTDLFEKRGVSYSSRPHRTMVTDLMGWNWLFSTMPYGDLWKRHRTLFHQYYHINKTADYHSYMSQETNTLLRNLLQTPQDFRRHVQRTAAAFVMQISYGHQVAPEGDMYVTLADKALAGLGQAGIFGSYLVDYLPWLKYIPAWMPGATFKKKALDWRTANQAMLNQPFEMVKRRLAAGTAVPCFATAELERWMNSSGDREYETLIKDVAAISYAAGADTTVSVILSFFLTMSIYPDIQKKAQAEIDRVIGTDRLPDFGDRNSLPYIDCIVWECLRWNPVTPLGLARTVNEDDEYRGYFIPKGTTILPNVWAILHDPVAYPDPLAFNPDRFADKEMNKKLEINGFPEAAFGFGRRICPGRHLAIDSVWINIARILAVFNVQKGLDEHGVPIEPDTQYTPTLLSRPRPFKCTIKPRSEAAAALSMEATQTHGY